MEILANRSNSSDEFYRGGAINCTDFVLKYDICLVGEKCRYSAQMIP